MDAKEGNLEGVIQSLTAMSSETTLALPMPDSTTSRSPNETDDPQIQLQGGVGVGNDQPREIGNIYDHDDEVRGIGDIERSNVVFERGTPPGPPPPPPDGGYGWVCVACVLVVNACTWGLNSVNYPPPIPPLLMLPYRPLIFHIFNNTDPAFRLTESISPTTSLTISTPLPLPTTTPSSVDSPSPPP